MKSNQLKLSALVGVALSSVFVGSAHIAQAQTATQPVEKPITIKLGGYFPNSSSGRSAGGNTEFSLGLDYALTKTATGNPFVPSVYFDLQNGKHNGGHADSYGLGVAGRYYFGVPGASVTPYLGAGIGVYDEQLKQGGSGGDSNVNVGGKVFGGVEFSSFLVEINYQLQPKHNGVNP
ncbi:MAG: hypothetical protein ACRYFS_17015, partial [Janthinobacterium lividum]